MIFLGNIDINDREDFQEGQDELLQIFHSPQDQHNYNDLVSNFLNKRNRTDGGICIELHYIQKSSES